MSSPTNSRPRLARATMCLALACALLGAAPSVPAAAQATKPSPLEALVPYDTTGSRTLQAIKDVAVAANAEQDVRHKRELSFVRAMALVDLWLIGLRTQSVKLLDGVAEAMGTPRSEVSSQLVRAINEASEPVVGDLVRDARMALLLTSPHTPNAGELMRGSMGLRAGSVFVHTVARALSEPNALEAMAALGVDPCASQTNCGELYAPFDEKGRRAIDALERALAASQHLRAEAQHDPFLAALSDQLAQDAGSLSAADLGPNARLAQGAGRARFTEAGSTAAPDLVMFVAEGQAELAFVPRVHVAEQGKLALYARGEPMLPKTQRVTLPSSFPAFVKSVPELVAALTPLVAQVPNAVLSIAAAPETPAHLWARALLSAQAASCPRIAMLSFDAEGVMRSLEVEVVSSLRASEVGPRDLNVVVRPGGFTVKRAGPVMTIPRVMKDEGFVFDFDGLVERAQPARARSAKLTFMSDVAAETLAETAFAVAPPQSALTVILP